MSLLRADRNQDIGRFVKARPFALTVEIHEIDPETRLLRNGMRERKAGIFAALKEDYQQLKKTEWGGYAGYDRFLDEPNNAKLASISIYSTLVPQFQQMIARHNRDLAAFYASIEISVKPKDTLNESAVWCAIR